MKIVCDACQAKYSISDDKVQGKVFKIRCKKCSNIIVVRGGANAGAAAEAAPAPQEKDTRVYDYGHEGGGAPAADDAVWHLVINQDQVGPMTADEVQQRFSAGEVDGETFAWREGFADWLPLSQVDAFASFAAGGAAVPSGGGGSAAVAAMFGGGDDAGTSKSDPNDLFASASASSSSRGEDDDGGDLFGSKPAAQPAAAAAGSPKLRGERNENSVLFSLNNLAQLASNTAPAPAPASSSSASSGGAGHATGAAGGEGSGLIDIRSMASAYLGGSGGGAAKPAAGASSGVGSIDDLPVFGGGGFSEPAVIVPIARQTRDNKVLYIMIAAVGLLAVVAVVMVVIMLKGGNKNNDKVAANDKTSSSDSDKGDKGDKGDTKPSGGDTKPSGGDTGAGSAAPTGGSSAAGGGDTGTQVATNDPKKPDPHTGGGATGGTPKTGGGTPAGGATPHTGGGTPAGGATGGTPKTGGGTPAGGATGGTPKTGGGTPGGGTPGGGATTGGGGDSCDEVSCVLNNYDGACCQKFKKAKAGGGAPKTGGGGNSNLPDSLDRGMISSGIGSIKSKAMACGDKSSAKGVVKVHVKVEGSGRVSSVSVSSSPDPALGACVSAAVQKASFSQTQNGGSFSYPFPF
jgi:TonB family protein